MPGRGNAKGGLGKGRAGAPPTMDGDRQTGRDDLNRDGAGMERGRADRGRPDSPGRSEQSPGHLKKAAGAQSARDYAPGRRGDDDDRGDDLRRGILGNVVDDEVTLT